MIKVILIKSKWNAFVRHQRMSCIQAELPETEVSEVSSNPDADLTDYPRQ